MDSFKRGDVVKRVEDGSHRYARVVRVEDSGDLLVEWDGNVRRWKLHQKRVYLVERGILRT